MARFFAFSVLLGSLAVIGCSADAQDPGAGSDDVKAGGQIGATCGGIAGLRCSPLLHCEITAQHPDAAGKCAAGADQGARCGGIAGIQCRQGLTCLSANHPDAMGTCERLITCMAVPTCDPGDRTVARPCAESDGCYSRSMCGKTVNCKGEVVTLEGSLETMFAIGGETTGFALKDKAGNFNELKLDEKERQAFNEGETARAHGRKTTVFGVEIPSRTVIDVARMTVCPEANKTINCQPPVSPDNGLCGEDRAWAEKACSGIRFLD
jgi:hypothetical protein